MIKWYYVIFKDNDLFIIKNIMKEWFLVVDKTLKLCEYFNAKGFFASYFLEGLYFDKKPNEWTRPKYSYDIYYLPHKKTYNDLIITEFKKNNIYSIENMIEKYYKKNNLQISFGDCVTGFTVVNKQFALVIPVNILDNKSIPDINYWKNVFPSSEFILTKDINDNPKDNLDYWNVLQLPLCNSFYIKSFKEKSKNFRDFAYNKTKDTI